MDTHVRRRDRLVMTVTIVLMLIVLVLLLGVHPAHAQQAPPGNPKTADPFAFADFTWRTASRSRCS